MKTVLVKISGDYCLNLNEINASVRSSDITETIYLDFQAEGVSVESSGVSNELLKVCADTGRDISTVKLLNNPNIIEKTPFENINASRLSFRSHFLSGDLIRAYWREPPEIESSACLFGLFIGRRTVSRDMILRQCLEYPRKFLFSMMNNPSGIQTYDDDEITQWISVADVDGFREWRSKIDIKSIDDKSIRDQYTRFVPKPVTNRSILEFYGRFKIEIVPETYTRGDCFFPTEKTARPIMACKPVLIFASKYFLARMRDLYGYRTYGDHWDESYDSLEGPSRWRAMWRSMQDINDATLSDAVLDIASHNRDILEKMMEWKI